MSESFCNFANQTDYKTNNNSKTVSRYNTKVKRSASEKWSFAVILVLSIVMIVLPMPRDTGNEIFAEIDYPWNGHELVAQFEFPLLKTEKEMAEARDSVRRHFAPFFKLHEGVSSGSISEWKNFATANGVNSELSNYIRLKLAEIYRSGVVSSTEYEQFITKNHVLNVNKVRGYESEHVSVAEIFTPKTAYQNIVNGLDTTRFSRSIVKQLNVANYIKPNLLCDMQRTNSTLNESLNDILPTSGRILKGTRIVDRGDIVTPEILQRIKSLQAEMQRRQETTVAGWREIVGQTLFVILLLGCLSFYLNLFRKDYLSTKRHTLLIAALVITMPVVTSLFVRYEWASVYLIPYAVIPILARVFTDSRTAYVINVIVVLLCSSVLSYPYEFVVIEMTAGMFAVYTLHELSERSQIFSCALVVTLVAIVMRFSLDLMREGDFDSIGWMWYVYLLIGGVILLFVYPLLFVFERTFGFSSTVTLIELSNMNNVLLRRMSEEAAGTFQHSMQVANLAAEVANHLGAKSQLVRTGALYHDIGKLRHPAFFTENQRGMNPHDKLKPHQSAGVIISHVQQGLDIAAKYNLPQEIRDFIATHHATSKAMFFYALQRELCAAEGTEVDETMFTYPGPNPKTIEQAILMMCDAVEAASRSLPEYTDESITGLVNKIIDGQVAGGYLANCNITFANIAETKAVLIEKLKTIYHTRISYPDLK